MYKIIGSDQQEYGPITAAQVREWIAQGRVDANTMAQAVGGTEWKPLGTFPEFAASFGQGAPSMPPILGAADPVKLTDEILARDYVLDGGRCLNRAWALMKGDFWPIIGVSALLMLIMSAAGGTGVGIVLNGPLMGGLFLYYLKKIRGQGAEVADLFSGFSLAFLPLFLGGLVTSFLTGIGFVFCILPGIYLALSWQFALVLIIDKRIDFWPAMEVSRKVVGKHFWSFLGFALLMFVVNLAGAIACCVGSFVTVPLTMLALMYAYEDVFQTPVAAPARLT